MPFRHNSLQYSGASLGRTDTSTLRKTQTFATQFTSTELIHSIISRQIRVEFISENKTLTPQSRNSRLVLRKQSNGPKIVFCLILLYKQSI